jgi:type II secretory ATPase GspE/PulE/Tfp pilus assembly ATPase PilB-like protein
MDITRYASAEAALNDICARAIRAGASDIHIEPQETYVRVRIRKDGEMTEIMRLAPDMVKNLAVRAKVIGGMNVGEMRIPQDGAARHTDGKERYDLRISALPSMWGETIVIRILSGNLPFIEENRLGMLPVQEETFRAALLRKSGMILTTGPTGSGKTSTLYTAMKLINTPAVNIISIEDPVEYRIGGITQVQVNEKAGLTFAGGLRALVRQDPDCIMIGEIRDRETAEIAVHAALTGHLVLSTLHTNNVIQAPLRLIDMGIPPYLLAASLTLLISQRLTRLSDGGGRTGIFEMLAVDERVREKIREKAPPVSFIEEMKRQHQPDMAAVARQKAAEGLISEEDAARISEGD